MPFTFNPFTGKLDAISTSFKPATRVVALSSSGFKADYYCDGTADDVQIQLALNDVNSLGGGNVLIKAGAYDITATLSVYSYTKFFGEGFSTILNYNYAAAGSSQLLIKNGNGSSGDTQFIISDMQLDGNTITGANPRNLVYLLSCNKCIVERLYIHDAPDSAIVLDQADCINNIIQNNIIDTTEDIGIYVSVANNNLVANNVILNTKSYGIRNVNSGAIRNQYIGNYVYNCGQSLGADGIRVLNGDSSTVTGNIVIQSGQNGIYVGSSYMTVTGNSVVASDEVGIYVDSTSGRGLITGNAVHTSSQSSTGVYAGIYLHNVSEMTVTGNRSGDTGAGTRQKYGILEDGTSDNNIIDGNMLKRNSTAGLSFVGASSDIGHNIE